MAVILLRGLNALKTLKDFSFTEVIIISSNLYIKYLLLITMYKRSKFKVLD